MKMRLRHGAAVALLLLCGIALAGPGGTPRTPVRGPEGPAPQNADLPPGFTLRALDGRTVALGTFLGREPVLLAFWTTWCPHCIDAIPSLNALNDGSQGGKMRILGVNYLETRKKVASVAKSRSIRYPVLLDEDGRVARAYGVVGIPTYVLIGRSGRIVYRGHVLPRNVALLQ